MHLDIKIKYKVFDTQGLGNEKMRVMVADTVLLLFSYGISHGLCSKHLIKIAPKCVKLKEHLQIQFMY